MTAEDEIADLKAEVEFLKGLLAGPGLWFPSLKLTLTQELVARALYTRPPDSYVTPDMLMAVLYGSRPDCDWPNVGIISVHICHLRRRLPQGSIINVMQRGYCLSEEGRAFLSGHASLLPKPKRLYRTPLGEINGHAL
jgi:hypothetical protein